MWRCGDAVIQTPDFQIVSEETQFEFASVWIESCLFQKAHLRGMVVTAHDCHRRAHR
jgi:hypothetical protein